MINNCLHSFAAKIPVINAFQHSNSAVRSLFAAHAALYERCSAWVRMRDRLKPILASTLLVVDGGLAYEHASTASAILTAITRREASLGEATQWLL
jgi:hypothetical protein